MNSLAIDIDIILRRIEGSKSNGSDVVLVEHDTMLKLIERVQAPRAKMVKAGSLSINPAFVASMEWDRRHYANMPGDNTLIVRMMDGAEHRILHSAHLLDGVDAYAIERTILTAEEK